MKEPVVSEHGEPLTWKTNDEFDAATAYALCRCGASANKPYCDGSHTDSGFDGTETASAKTYVETRVSLGSEGVEIYDDRAICVHAGFCGNRVTLCRCGGSANKPLCDGSHKGNGFTG